MEPIHALKVNAVSQQVLDQMAIQVQQLFTSHWGVGITGYATPVPESGKKIYACFSIAYGGEIVRSGELKGVGKNPKDVQHNYTEAVINKLHDLLASE